jgi:hypothetical protein
MSRLQLRSLCGCAPGLAGNRHRGLRCRDLAHLDTSQTQHYTSKQCMENPTISWLPRAYFAAGQAGGQPSLQYRYQTSEPCCARSRAQTLLPAIDQLLVDEDWARWEQDLGRLWCDEGEVRELTARHAAWHEAQAQRKQARLEAQLLEAQALENRAEE